MGHRHDPRKPQGFSEGRRQGRVGRGRLDAGQRTLGQFGIVAKAAGTAAVLMTNTSTGSEATTTSWTTKTNTTYDVSTYVIDYTYSIGKYGWEGISEWGGGGGSALGEVRPVVGALAFVGGPEVLLAT